MSGPESGKYLIRLADGRQPLIGVDFTYPINKVVTDGSNHIWTVSKLKDGNYTLALEEAGHPVVIQEEYGNLVARETQSPGVWSIQVRDDGLYTIEVQSHVKPTTAWTVWDSQPKSFVTLSFIANPRPNQLWDFIPLKN